MADQNDVRRIALALPNVRQAPGRFAFSVENKGKHHEFAWTWNERVVASKPRVPRPDVLAVRVRDHADKAALLAGDPDRFFTEPHYEGFPAVLVRLPRVSAAELRELLADAWRCRAPKQLVVDHDSARLRPATRPAARPRVSRTRRAAATARRASR